MQNIKEERRKIRRTTETQRRRKDEIVMRKFMSTVFTVDGIR